MSSRRAKRARSWGLAGGQRLRDAGGACPRSPAEWRLPCDPSPGRGRQGCCSARSCSCRSSAAFQVGALSSAAVGVSGLGKEAKGCVRWEAAGSSAGALTPGLCPLPAASREPLEREVRAGSAGAPATVAASRSARPSSLRSPGRALGADARCPLSPPVSSCHCPRSGRVFASAPSPGTARPPARLSAWAAVAARGFIYIVSLVAASPRRGAPLFREAPGFVVGTASHFRAGEEIGELSVQVRPLSAPAFPEPDRMRRKREGWHWKEKRSGSFVAHLCPGGEEEVS